MAKKDRISAPMAGVDEAQAAAIAAGDARRGRKPKATAAPLTFAGKLRMAKRVAGALDGLSLVQQKGVIGIAAVTGPEHAGALVSVLRILASCASAAERKSVVATVAGALEGETEIVVGEAEQRLIPGTSGDGQAAGDEGP